MLLWQRMSPGDWSLIGVIQHEQIPLSSKRKLNQGGYLAFSGHPAVGGGEGKEREGGEMEEGERETKVEC